MSGSHGELFGEIGELVLAAQAGQAIDLSAKSGELARRYCALGISEEMIVKAITRSIGAISFSMARVSTEKGEAAYPATVNGNGHNGHDQSDGAQNGADDLPPLPKSLFPSGLRLAVLS